MSKIIIIAVFIFWAGLSFFYANSLVKQNLFGGTQTIPINPNTKSNNVVASASDTSVLTLALIAEHNSPADCWVTVGDNVYDVTSYIKVHPGGQNSITAYCGIDIQVAFDSQEHSANARNIFASYQIGTIGTVLSADTVNNVREDDDEWNDD